MHESTSVKLQLPKDAVFQILDCLEIRADQWEYSKRYHETGLVEDDIIGIECSDTEEASGMAKYYKNIIQLISKQI